MIALAHIYIVGGVFFAAASLLSLVDASNPRRLLNCLFWGLVATSFLAGSLIGDLSNGGLALSWLGETDAAIGFAQRALQLSPFDPFNFLAYNTLAISYFQTRRYNEAHEAAKRSVQMSPRFVVSHSFLVTALVGLGRDEDAKLAAQRLLAIDPTFSVNRFATTVRIVPEVFNPFADAWKAAGIPEGDEAGQRAPPTRSTT